MNPTVTEMDQRPPRFLEVEYGLWQTPVGLKFEREMTMNDIGVAILGSLNDSVLDEMRKHPHPMRLLKEKYPEKLKLSRVQVDLYEHLDDYNYVFTVYGRDNEKIYTLPYEEIQKLKENALLPLSTIDDEMWANPYAVLYHTPGVNRESYLGRHSAKSLAAVRNYLCYEDPEYLNVCPVGDIKALFLDLYKRGIVKRLGAYYVPTRMKTRPRLKFKSKIFKPLHCTFGVLAKFPESLNDIECPRVIPLETLLNDRPVLRLFMDESNNGYQMVYGSPYFDGTIERQKKKMTINRIIMIFKSRQAFLSADRTAHYNHPNVSRLQYVAYQIQKQLPKRVIFNSFFNS